MNRTSKTITLFCKEKVHKSLVIKIESSLRTMYTSIIYICVCEMRARASLFSCLLGLWTIAGKALFKSSFFFIIFLIIIYYAALINKEINKVTEHYTARSYQRDEVIRSTETIQRVSVFLDVLLMEIPGKMWRWKIIRKSNWKTN